MHIWLTSASVSEDNTTPSLGTNFKFLLPACVLNSSPTGNRQQLQHTLTLSLGVPPHSSGSRCPLQVLAPTHLLPVAVGFPLPSLTQVQRPWKASATLYGRLFRAAHSMPDERHALRKRNCILVPDNARLRHKRHRSRPFPSQFRHPDCTERSPSAWRVSTPATLLPPNDQRFTASFTRFFAPSCHRTPTAQNDGLKGGRSKRKHRCRYSNREYEEGSRERRHIRVASTTRNAMRQHSAFPSYRDALFVVHEHNGKHASRMDAMLTATTFEGSHMDFAQTSTHPPFPNSGILTSLNVHFIARIFKAPKRYSYPEYEEGSRERRHRRVASTTRKAIREHSATTRSLPLATLR
jgi:hypothetical protein